MNLEHTKRYQPTEGPGKECTSKEERNAETEFTSGVKKGEVENHASKEACLKSAQQQSNNQHASKVLRGTLKQRHRAPADHY